MAFAWRGPSDEFTELIRTAENPRGRDLVCGRPDLPATIRFMSDGPARSPRAERISRLQNCDFLLSDRRPAGFRHYRLRTREAGARGS